MKIELTLPNKLPFLHFMSLLDLLALVFSFVALLPVLQLQPGVSINLPKSSFFLKRLLASDPIVITVIESEPAQVFIGQNLFSLDEVEAYFIEEKSKPETLRRTAVILRVEGAVPTSLERALIEISQKHGLTCHLAADEAPLSDEK